MKVVIAIDDSPYSQKMLQMIKHRKWPVNTEFKVVNVIEPIQPDAVRYVEEDEGGTLQELNRRRKAHSTDICENARHLIQEAVNDSIVHFEVRQGDASQQVLSAAAEWDADRIVMGAHGHSVCPHNIAGSVSQNVAHKAHCAVEVVRC